MNTRDKNNNNDNKKSNKTAIRIKYGKCSSQCGEIKSTEVLL